MIGASVHHGYDGTEECRPSLVMERDDHARGLQVRAPAFPLTPGNWIKQGDLMSKPIMRSLNRTVSAFHCRTICCKPCGGFCNHSKLISQLKGLISKLPDLLNFTWVTSYGRIFHKTGSVDYMDNSGNLWPGFTHTRPLSRTLSPAISTPSNL